MNAIFYLLRASWRDTVLASLAGGISGAASIALMAMIRRTLEDPAGSNVTAMILFASFCVVVLVTRIASQVLVSRLTQRSLLKLQMNLCRRILDAPIKRIEEIGSARLLTVLTGDVNTVAHAMSLLPGMGVDFVILLSGAIYLGTLSLNLMLAAVFFCVFGVVGYWLSAQWADKYIERARREQDLLQQRIQELIEGVKELKLHTQRRQEFVEDVLLQSATKMRHSQFIGECLQNAAISWGRLAFFIAIGLLLFVWPKFMQEDTPTLVGYVLTILYLMSPLDQLVGAMPTMNWAAESLRQIKTLDFSLDQKEPTPDVPRPMESWGHIELVGVTHAYRGHGRPRGFLLGPLNLTITAGETVFVIGGNGSGKTTLAKLLTGLYVPESGEVRLDGQPMTNNSRDSYRQLFSVVFDDAMVFDRLLGLDPENLDIRAQEYLRSLELDHVVSITNGLFSTRSLSRGQRKRLALLTAYLEDRPIYLFDEWAADQDPTFRKVFYLRLLPELKRRGKTVVAITHDDRFFDCADRIVKLEDGKIVELLRDEAQQELEMQMTSADKFRN